MSRKRMHTHQRNRKWRTVEEKIKGWKKKLNLI